MTLAKNMSIETGGWGTGYKGEAATIASMFYQNVFVCVSALVCVSFFFFLSGQLFFVVVLY